MVKALMLAHGYPPPNQLTSRGELMEFSPGQNPPACDDHTHVMITAALQGQRSDCQLGLLSVVLLVDMTTAPHGGQLGPQRLRGCQTTAK